MRMGVRWRFSRRRALRPSWTRSTPTSPQGAHLTKRVAEGLRDSGFFRFRFALVMDQGPVAP